MRPRHRVKAADSVGFLGIDAFHLNGDWGHLTVPLVPKTGLIVIPGIGISKMFVRIPISERLLKIIVERIVM